MNRYNQQRRNVLHGALAVGCALAAPLLLTGCSNQESPPTAATTDDPAKQQGSRMTGETPPEPAVAADDAVDQNSKTTMAQANYQEQPQGDQQCGNCMQFVAANNTCNVVAGEISPQGWCMLWLAQG